MKAVKIVDDKRVEFEVPEGHVSYVEKEGVRYAVVTGINYTITHNAKMTWGWTKVNAVPELYVLLKGIFTFVCTMSLYDGDLEDELSMRLIGSGAPTVHEFLKAKVEAEGKEGG